VSTVAIVWLIVGLVSTATVIAVLIGLVRHVLVLLRALRRFSEELAPIASEISAESGRASSRTQRMSRPGSAGRSPGPAVR